MALEIVEHAGWPENVRLANEQIELIITKNVGPRVIRFGFIGGPNIFGTFEDQLGKSGEDEWMIRGGHRLWVAPEAKPWSYELDNTDVQIEQQADGAVTAGLPKGPITGIAKTMQIALAPDANVVTVTHTLKNEGAKPVVSAVWALTVMAKRGLGIIPLPIKQSHENALLHNQEWSIWAYTDFSDPRWTLGARYVTLRQDPARSATKLGVAHREGWIGYLLDGYLFVKRFERVPDARYPDGGVNFETFTNEEILELESLGPLGTLEPGQSATHQEQWELFKDVPDCANEDELDEHVRSRL